MGSILFRSTESLNRVRLTYLKDVLCEVIFTFLLSGRRHVRILGLFLDVEVDIVLLHVEVDGGS